MLRARPHLVVLLPQVRRQAGHSVLLQRRLAITDVDKDVADPVTVPFARRVHVVAHLAQSRRDVRLVPDVTQRQRVQDVAVTSQGGSSHVVYVASSMF